MEVVCLENCLDKAFNSRLVTVWHLPGVTTYTLHLWIMRYWIRANFAERLDYFAFERICITLAVKLNMANFRLLYNVKSESILFILCCVLFSAADCAVKSNLVYVSLLFEVDTAFLSSIFLLLIFLFTFFLPTQNLSFLQWPPPPVFTSCLFFVYQVLLQLLEMWSLPSMRLQLSWTGAGRRTVAGVGTSPSLSSANAVVVLLLTAATVGPSIVSLAGAMFAFCQGPQASTTPQWRWLIC